MALEEALWTFAFMNLADVATTISALKRGGAELNPVARLLINRFGFTGLFILKYLAMGLSILAVSLQSPGLLEEALWIWSIVLGGVVAWNSLMNVKYMKRSG